MKPASVALVALLAAAGGLTPLVQFDLYTFTLVGGGQLLYTTADFAILAPDATIWNAPTLDGSGTLWTPGMTWAPFMIDAARSRVTAKWKTGLDADSWPVSIMPRPFDLISGALFPDQIGSVPWLNAALGGALDNADVIVSRAYFSAMPTHPIPVAGLAPVGTLILFRGQVGQIDFTGSTAVVTINDYKAMLSQQMPQQLYQASCKNRLFDARCTLSAATFTKTGTAASGSTKASIVAVVAAPGGSATFTLGTLTMTSGFNAGFSRLVSNWDGAAFALLNPFPFTLAAGDTFSVTAGCNKTQAQCALFANSANFRAETYIPVPEISLG